ncbi:MAG TPA: hypothetical protein VFR90_08745 [Methylibium sp.]|uniref:hypothetical protein n=1 Tax=Methylibium sp. TaxID=2067992 RepID=UPI002DBC4045|nr:hypothetical protein [Methylibium sp.]HEU4459194.1 hypothetical protein [Methylibium sp.]
MSARLVAFFVWAVAAACAAYWGLRLVITPRPVPSQAQSVSMSAAQRGDIARLFATAPVAADTPVEPGLAARFKLVGVMAPGSAEAGQGVALISIDDKPPRAYRVGARVDQSLVLQSVAKRSASIGPAQGAAAVKLELPAPALPATGNLPSTQSILGAGTLPASPPPYAPPVPPAPGVAAPPIAPTLPPSGNPDPSLGGGGANLPPAAQPQDPLNDPSTRR